MRTEEYSPYLKDDLVRTYNFIEKFQNEHEFAKFTVEGVNRTMFHLNGDFVGEKYASKFIAKLEDIKELAINQPEYKFKAIYEMRDKNGVFISVDEFEFSIKSYDKEKVFYRCRLEHPHATKIIPLS